MIDLNQYDFELPESCIAKHPVSPRDSSKLMHVPLDSSAGPTDHTFTDIVDFLQPGDLLVLNSTRVVPARLFGVDSKARRFEVLLLEPVEGVHTWSCLVRPGRYVREPDSELEFTQRRKGKVRRSPTDPRRFEIRFEADSHSFWNWLESAGEMPLPPYLKRPATEADRQDYQTVYAQTPGSVAAPTAGLHFTPQLLETLSTRGVGLRHLTLTIGYGTFGSLDPLATELHSEGYEIPLETWQAVQQTRAAGGRVVAVGTTSLRALESAAQAESLVGATRLFIRPGFEFKAVSGLITNFHLPRSSLFILVSAFMGRERALDCYQAALERGYRFFSYGDAMALL